jgi:hypothetical protein
MVHESESDDSVKYEDEYWNRHGQLHLEPDRVDSKYDIFC